MRRLAWLVLIACGSASSASPPQQLRAPWERPVDSAKVAAAAKASKALGCIGDYAIPVMLQYSIPPEVSGALAEAHALHHADTLGDDVMYALGFHAYDSAHRLLAAARAAHVKVADYLVEALEGKGTSARRDAISLIALVEAGRLDDVRASYAAVEANGGFDGNAASSNAFMLGALGRTDDALKLVATQPSDRRVAFDTDLLYGTLASAAPAVAIDRVIAALMHDTGGDPAANVTRLANAAAAVRGRGLGDHARAIRHYLTSWIESSRDAAALVNVLAPEVLAVGGADERRELDALATKLGADAFVRMRWERALYTGTVAQALAVTRESPTWIARLDDLYFLWARAAVEGFDPATMKAIDDLACAPH